MVKRMLACLLALTMVAALCACGGTPAQADPSAATAAEPAAQAEQTEVPAEASAPAEEEPEEAGDTQYALPDAALHEAEEAQASEDADPASDAEIAQRLETAQGFVGKDAAALIDALGEPLERRYAPSCLGNGEDGELSYRGFTVYTYREGGRETVSEVVGG